MRHAMQCFARATPASEIRDLPGVLITSAAVETPVFNAAFLTEPVPGNPVELDHRITAAKLYYDAHALAWSYWVCEDLLDARLRRRAASAFRRRGLRAATKCPGMIADRIQPARRDFPALECLRVGNAETRLDFCNITSVCFRIPFETSLAIYNCARTWETDFIAYAGYLDGKAVATAATVTAAGAIGVYSVATLPRYQGCGIAEKLTRHALEKARNASGIECSVLQSTGSGHSLYTRMGYRTVTSITVYVSH